MASPANSIRSACPAKLQTALDALYGHYEKTFELWEEAGIGVPPVFIVVCNNTSTSKLVYDFISGFERTSEEAMAASSRAVSSCSAIMTNTGNGSRARDTLLIDSDAARVRRCARPRVPDHGCRRDRALQQRSSGSAKDDFRAGEKITDQDLLREVMNTVGKAGRLGESIRCVVSVSMLTEGWDANTVTHILGVRAFGTQLLCEQVVGRGLRRQSYDLNEKGLFQRRICRRARHSVRLYRQAGGRATDQAS